HRNRPEPGMLRGLEPIIKCNRRADDESQPQVFADQVEPARDVIGLPKVVDPALNVRIVEGNSDFWTRSDGHVKPKNRTTGSTGDTGKGQDNTNLRIIEKAASSDAMR